jgi:hypothetical protein
VHGEQGVGSGSEGCLPEPVGQGGLRMLSRVSVIEMGSRS